MKISIIGFSGSGKSTLAKTLSKHYNIPVLHMDSIHFLDNWKERSNEEFNSIVKEFIDKNESWIIDGNYKSIVPERHEMADLLIFLDYNRFFCYKSAKERYKKYIGKTRDDMASGCEEKFDKEFRCWLLYKGRTRKRRLRLLQTAQKHPNSLIFKNRKQLFKYYKEKGIDYDE
jgi:adenylate kinase family enzyme